MNPKHFRILAIAPGTRGFGFAVLEGKNTLVDWGVKTVQGNKNVQSLAKVKELITHYQPGVLVLQDTSTKSSRRSSSGSGSTETFGGAVLNVLLNFSTSELKKVGLRPSSTGMASGK